MARLVRLIRETFRYKTYLKTVLIGALGPVLHLADIHIRKTADSRSAEVANVSKAVDHRVSKVTGNDQPT
jgi:hypothetical protein